MLNLFIILTVSLFFFSCIHQTENAEKNKSKIDTVEQAEEKEITFDSSECISLKNSGFKSLCPISIFCPDDSQRFKTIQLMLYVDSNLADNEPKAINPSCAMLSYFLSKTSVEIIIFWASYGGNYDEWCAYIRRGGEKFKRIKSFDGGGYPTNFTILKSSTQTRAVNIPVSTGPLT